MTKALRVGFNARLLRAPDLRGWNRYTLNLLAELPAVGVEPVLYSDRPIHPAHLDRLAAGSYVVRVEASPALRGVGASLAAAGLRPRPRGPAARAGELRAPLVEPLPARADAPRRDRPGLLRPQSRRRDAVGVAAGARAAGALVGADPRPPGDHRQRTRPGRPGRAARRARVEGPRDPRGRRPGDAPPAERRRPRAARCAVRAGPALRVLRRRLGGAEEPAVPRAGVRRGVGPTASSWCLPAAATTSAPGSLSWPRRSASATASGSSAGSTTSTCRRSTPRPSDLRLPERVRRIRPSALRGDGRRLPRAGRAGDVPPRGARRRRRDVRPGRRRASWRPCCGASPTNRPSATTWSAAPAPAPATSPGDAPPSPPSPSTTS